MKARVYLETSVVSYLTAKRSRDLVSAAHQQITADWWEGRRADFDLVVSELVVGEASQGDPDAARRRLEALEGIPLLDVTEEARQLAVAVIREGLLPAAAFPDALHIATATIHEVDYLLTWNCAHIANAELLPRVAKICDAFGYRLPYICTPEELIGGPHGH